VKLQAVPTWNWALTSKLDALIQLRDEYAFQDHGNAPSLRAATRGILRGFDNSVLVDSRYPSKELTVRVSTFSLVAHFTAGNYIAIGVPLFIIFSINPVVNENTGVDTTNLGWCTTTIMAGHPKQHLTLILSYGELQTSFSR
jgi:hypothetical protein